MKRIFRGGLSGRIAGGLSGRRRVSLLAGITLAAVGLTSVLITGGAGASGETKPAAVKAALAPAMSPRLSKAQVANVYRYWTKARKDSAKSADIALGGNAAAGAKAVNAGSTATGTPGVAGGFKPAGLASIQGGSSPPNTSYSQDATVLPADGGYPGPNDTWDWYGKYITWPTSTIGKLFFTEPGGNFVCSAAATYGGGNLDTVWTAGHCVGPGGGQSYYSNWLFCPAYNNGENAKFGCWAWALAQQTGGWYFNGNYSADYAYLHMASTGDKLAESVASATGGLGFAWNFARDQHWTDFGYPSGSPYDGTQLVVTAAEHRYDVTNPDSCGGSCSQDVSMGSKQTPGFSGGPWILSFGGNSSEAPKDPYGHGDWINGDNSYYFTSGGPGGTNEYGTEIQGPYYDTAACSFWKGGTGWTGTC